MQTMCEPHRCHWYVNTGEYEAYNAAGAHYVQECGNNICEARNVAIIHANGLHVPCIQISDDLRNVKQIWFDGDKKKTTFESVSYVCKALIWGLNQAKLMYGGVAVSSNPLNFTGIAASFDKLVVNDFICLMPGAGLFDETLALKEDYDMSIRHLLGAGVLRLNNVLCEFPHRQNKGGANTYRDDSTEGEATRKLIAKWPDFVRMNPRRPGQVLLNYKAIREFKNSQNKNKLFNL